MKNSFTTVLQKKVSIICISFIIAIPYAKSNILTWVGGDNSMPNCWTNANNWDLGSIPDVDDDVIIPETSYNPYISVSVSVNSLNIEGLYTTVTLDGTHSLTVSNNVSVSTASSSLVTGKSTVFVGGSILGGGTINLNGNGILFIAGDLSVGNIIAGTGVKSMVVLNGLNQHIAKTYKFNNLQVGSSNATTVYFLADQTVNVALSGYGTVNCGNHTLNLIGDMTVKYFVADSGTVNLTGYTNAQSQVINGYNFYNLTIDNNKTYLSGNVTISHNLNFISGNILLRSYNLTILPNAKLTWNGYATVDYTSGYVVTCSSGYFTMNGSAQGTVFPVGYSMVEYNPVTISTSSTSSVFDVKVYDGVTDKFGSPLTTNGVNETWIVAPHSNYSSVVVTPQWTDGSNFDAAQELYPFNRNNAVVSYRSNLNYPSQWKPSGSGGSSIGDDPYTRISGSISMLADSLYYISVGGAGISALPVTLLSFDAVLENDAVNLNWITSSEINNNYFQVERSTNGFDWNTIGQIKGHGSSQTQNNYAAVDNLSDIVASGTLYYRLKQVDYNGGFTYSEIRPVEITLKTFAVQTYPNPANQYINIDWMSSNGAVTQLRLVNTNGIQVYANNISGIGALHQQINMEGFPSGNYILQVICGTEISSRVVYKD